MPVITLTEHDQDAISDQLQEQLLSHNTTVEKAC